MLDASGRFMTRAYPVSCNRPVIKEPIGAMFPRTTSPTDVRSRRYADHAGVAVLVELPGRVTRHIEALADCFLADGHDVRVLAPFDPLDRLSAFLHRGVPPQPISQPDYLIPLGRTEPRSGRTERSRTFRSHLPEWDPRELRSGGYDVVHIHEPVAPAIGWTATDWTPTALVGTFHTYNEHWLSHGDRGCPWRPAHAEPAARPHRRIPTRGVDRHAVLRRALPRDPERRAPRSRPGGRGRLPCLCRPVADRVRGPTCAAQGPTHTRSHVEKVREQVPVELTLIGPRREPPPRREQPGRAHPRQRGRRPETGGAGTGGRPVRAILGGESFGMVLTEALAAGTPVIASNIAGYHDVVRNGVDGILVPPGDPDAIASALRQMRQQPARRPQSHGCGPGRRVALPGPEYHRVLEAYEDATATPAPSGLVRRAAVRVGMLPRTWNPPRPPVACRAWSRSEQRQPAGSHTFAEPDCSRCRSQWWRWATLAIRKLGSGPT